MKIGMITFHWAAGLGGQLQTYALKQVLEKLGHTVTVINHDESNGLEFPKSKIQSASNFWIRLKRWITYSICYYKYAYPRYKAAERYTDFAARHFKVNLFWRWSHSTLKARVKDLDLLVCGSDQIWNASSKIRPVYFGVGLPVKRKIAYAGSAGSNANIPETLRAEFINYTKNYDAVSCRETETADFINAYEPKTLAVTVLDPTLLLTEKDYLPILHPPEFPPKKPFVFVYELWEDQSLRDEALAFTKQHGCEWILHTREPDPRYGPSEELWYIKNAVYVITNSFHATVFSFLFGKPFIPVAPANGKARLETLLTELNLKKYLLPQGAPHTLFAPPSAEDFKRANQLLTPLREKSLNWLKEAIGK